MGLVHLICGGLIKDAAQQMAVMRQTTEMWVERVGVHNMGMGEVTFAQSHAILIQIKRESQSDILNTWCFCSVGNFFLYQTFFSLVHAHPLAWSCILLLKCQHKSTFWKNVNTALCGVWQWPIGLATSCIWTEMYNWHKPLCLHCTFSSPIF